MQKSCVWVDGARIVNEQVDPGMYTSVMRKAKLLSRRRRALSRTECK